MFKSINTFYDDLFQYHYQKLVGKDKDPEVSPIVLISICQTTHVLLLLEILYFTMGLERWGDKSWVAASIMPLFIIFGSIHIYRFVWKSGVKRVLKRNKILPPKFGLYSVLYFLSSISLPLLVTFLFIEFF